MATLRRGPAGLPGREGCGAPGNQHVACRQRAQGVFRARALPLRAPMSSVSSSAIRASRLHYGVAKRRTALPPVAPRRLCERMAPARTGRIKK
jgi:hypothetical protein